MHVTIARVPHHTAAGNGVSWYGARVQLHGTPLSHFTRKIRILAAELGIAYEFVRQPSVLAPDPAAYGDNPLLRIPTLVDGDVTVIDSDHIARYLVGKFDPADRLDVTGRGVDGLNRLAVANGVMANEVVIILAKRAGLTDIEGVAYFGKLATAIDNGLAWLETHLGSYPDRFDYADIAMVCMWQHVVHYQLAMLAPLDRYPRLAARVAHLTARPSVATTTPAASLRFSAAPMK